MTLATPGSDEPVRSITGVDGTTGAAGVNGIVRCGGYGDAVGPPEIGDATPGEKGMGAGATEAVERFGFVWDCGAIGITN